MAFESDWAFLRAALPELQEYILSNDLYRPLSGVQKAGSAQALQLTIGNVLLSQARLSAQPQVGKAVTTGRSAEAVREEWRSNWGRKAAKEFSSRLNLWQLYLRELRGDPRGQAPFYANEVRQRVILHLLRSEILEGVPPHEEDQLTMLDGLVRSLTVPGEFLWEPEVQPSFPRNAYWFLYVSFAKL